MNRRLVEGGLVRVDKFITIYSSTGFDKNVFIVMLFIF